MEPPSRLAIAWRGSTSDLHQSIESTTGRPSAVRTRRSAETGVPASKPRAVATRGGAGSAAHSSDLLPGFRAIASIRDETEKFRLRSFRTLDRWGRYVPEPR